jgi:N-acetylglutamate synthase-like GNAT family acetyltransferase
MNLSDVRQVTSDAELKRVVDLRYRILRQPWNQPYDSSSDALESASVNAYIERDGKVVACGRLQRNEPKTGQIRYMAVDASYRGEGLGRLILAYLEHRAMELGMRTIELQARENALAFYLRNGYHMVEKTFLLWGQVQHYLMSKSL